MFKKYFIKFVITLGLLLFFTLLTPLMPYHIQSAKAGEITSNLDKEKVNNYRLNLKSITLVSGKSFTLRVYNLGKDAKVSYKSNDSEIASVSDEGTITANKVGTTVITATIKDGITTESLTCDVTVGPPAFSVRLTKSRIILGLNQSDLLKVILKPSNTAEVARFSSYDPSIATVSTGGRVTAQGLGLTYLFAEIDAKDSYGNNKFAVCTLIVTDPDNTSALQSYFNNRPELGMISESDLLKALEDFFNGSGSDATKDGSVSLVDALDQFLNKRFDLSSKEEDKAATTESSKTEQKQEVISGSKAENTVTKNN